MATRDSLYRFAILARRRGRPALVSSGPVHTELRNRAKGAVMRACDSGVALLASVNNTLTSNANVGLYVSNYLGPVVLTGKNRRGSAYAIQFSGMRDTVLDNTVAGAAPNLLGDNRSGGFYGGSANNVTIRGFDASGAWPAAASTSGAASTRSSTASPPTTGTTASTSTSTSTLPLASTSRARARARA